MPSPSGDVVEIKEVSAETVEAGNSNCLGGSNNSANTPRTSASKEEGDEEGEGLKDVGTSEGERVGTESGSTGGPEQVVSTIDAQLQHNAYRGLEVDKDKVAGLQADGAERAGLDELGPDGVETAKLRTKNVSFATMNDENVYPPGHASGPAANNTGRDNSSHSGSRYLRWNGTSFRFPFQFFTYTN